jgi:CheY-like chemotaxis protein
MNKQPIYIVDDDVDDNVILEIVWEDLGLGNELICFTNGKDLLDQLENDEQIPFIIICALNLPQLSGFEIREQLYSNPQTRYKTVPFIFWSNSASKEQIKKAYDLGAHGMFIKGTNPDELKKNFTRIVDYWHTSLKPA